MKNLLFFLALLVSASAFSQESVRLKNRHTEEYLFIKDKIPAMSQTESTGESAVWEKEVISGTDCFRLRNGSTGQYLHTENGLLEAGSIKPGWWSAMWRMIPVSGTRFVQIQNRYTGVYIHKKFGKPEAGTIVPSWQSAQWSAEPVQPEQTGIVNYNNVRPDVPKHYPFSVTNKSMWDVSFRVRYRIGWTDWKYARVSANPKKVTAPQGKGSILGYEIRWKDLATWREFPGGIPIALRNSSMHVQVSGNTLTGIKIK